VPRSSKAANRKPQTRTQPCTSLRPAGSCCLCLELPTSLAAGNYCKHAYILAAAACFQMVLSLVPCYAMQKAHQLASSRALCLLVAQRSPSRRRPSVPALPINPCRRWDRAHHHVAAVCISKLAVLALLESASWPEPEMASLSDGINLLPT
jgi:hypothetical protein